MSDENVSCVYCGAPATTRDRCPPRCLLEQPFPKNLFVVPSCAACNSGFSLDEQYFLTILAKISTAPALASKLEDGGTIARALSRSRAFDKRLFRALGVDEEDGRVYITPEQDRIRKVIGKIALGLFVRQYKAVPSLDSITKIAAYPYSIRDDRPAPLFIANFTERFRNKKWNHVQPDVFSYIIVRDPKWGSKLWCVMDFHQTLWGLAHLPNPRSVRARSKPQLWLAQPELAF